MKNIRKHLTFSTLYAIVMCLFITIILIYVAKVTYQRGLENLANEAALMAARRGHQRITHGDFERAKDKIQLGTLRDEAMSEKEKELTAYHEAGHALLALLLPETDPVHSVTIVPRGRALGVTQQLPMEDINNYSKTYLLNRIAILLGGRAAEDLIFQEFTTGASNSKSKWTW